MKKITLIALLFISLTSFSQTWTALTTGTTTNLISISFANDNVGWAVGSSGKIINTVNAGSTWTSQTSGTSQVFYSVCALNANTAIAVGDASTIKRTTDGGTTWNSISAPASADLRGIWFLDSNTGFITGGPSSFTGVVFKTIDAGLTWTSLSVSIGATYGVFFTDANNGYVSDGFGSIIKTTDGGITWANLTSGTSVLLDYIFFTNMNTGYISGQNGTILKTTDAGATWAPLTIGTSDRLFGIKFLDAATGFISGGNVGSTNSGFIYKTMNAGATWTLETTNINRFYRGSFPSYAAGYVCGLSGTVVKITNINSGLGIAENSAAHFDFDVFPNPFSNSFSVTVNLKEEGEASVKIYDELGKMCVSQSKGVLSKGVNKLEFNNLNLSPGVYMVEMKIGDITESKKLIKTE